ncbi:hypothetical protein HP10700_09311 [Helicobacter pylori 10700]|nr:hypothetical protein HP10700_09311 [Helicobacter pylori 10700]KAF0998003.1 hypothetical protein HPYSS1_06802 [Helicobacter pylori SS1]KAF0999396.1 hypothetical protein HPSS1190_02930 [Helicobacter pylori SS1_190]
MIVKNASSVLDFYSLFFILYSVSVAFLFLLFLTFLVGVLGFKWFYVFLDF